MWRQKDNCKKEEEKNGINCLQNNGHTKNSIRNKILLINFGDSSVFKIGQGLQNDRKDSSKLHNVFKIVLSTMSSK
jgi:hypothetical protein